MKNLLCAMLLLAPLLASAETRMDCPEWYPTELLSVKGSPQGWDGVNNIAVPRLNLKSSGVVAGPPKRYPQGIQMGEETKTKKGYKLTFIALDKFTEHQEIWAYCAYGLGSDFQLLRRMPDGTKECVADHTKTKYGDYAISMVCH